MSLKENLRWGIFCRMVNPGHFEALALKLILKNQKRRNYEKTLARISKTLCRQTMKTNVERKLNYGQAITPE